MVYDVVPEPVAELVAAGATAAATVAELAGQVDVLCVMVRDDDQVRDVLGQALGTLRPGSVFVVHSTIAPLTPRQLEVTASRHDVLVLDAAVSGGPMGAIDGTLAIMVRRRPRRRTPRRSRSWSGWAPRSCTPARSAPGPR